MTPLSLLVAVRGDPAASHHHPAACHLGRPAARPGQTPAHRARPHRRLPRRRALPRPLARPVLRAAWPPLGPGPDPAAPALLEAPLPPRLRQPLQGGRRLDLLAAVLPHPLGPARPP